MQQEVDVLELGRKVAACLKGENSPAGAQIVAGRAYRGLWEFRRQLFWQEWGKPVPWQYRTEEALTQLTG